MEVDKKLSYWEFLQQKYNCAIKSYENDLNLYSDDMINKQLIEYQAKIEIYKKVIEDLKIRK
jgi:hypothetical protein